MPDITITVSQGLADKLTARFGNIPALRQWTRDAWREDFRNWKMAQAQIQAQAIIDAAQNAANAEDLS